MTKLSICSCAVDLAAVERGLEVVQLVGVGLVGEDGGAVVGLEGVADGIAVVAEVEHEDVALLGVGAVEAGEGLHGLDAGEHLVDVHGVQERLVVAGLELVGADEEAVRVLLKVVGDAAGGEAVETGFADLLALVFGFAGEGDEGLVGAFAFLQVCADGVVVVDGALDAVGDDHGARLAAELAGRAHLFVEVVDHDFGLEADGVVMVFDVAAQLSGGAAGVELGVLLDRFDEAVVAVDRGVVRQHIHDEAFLDGLLHGVAVEGEVAGGIALGIGGAEDFECLVLGRGGEGEVAGVGQQLSALHEPVDDVLGGLLLGLGAGLAERHVERGGGASALAGVGFVDDDAEAVVPGRVADVVEDEGELLDGGNDDALAFLEQAAEVL